MLETSFSLTGQRVIDAMQQMSLGRSLPKAITVDHGTAFTSNAFIESFNGGLRDERLNGNEFASIEDVRQKIEAWWQDYNHHRPHSSLGHLITNEFATQGQETASKTAKLY